MRRNRPLAVLTLAAVTFATPGCRTCAQAGEFLGAVLGTAAVVMVENTDFDDDDDDHHEHRHEHRCRRRR
jgi:hypothetical protein